MSKAMDFQCARQEAKYGRANGIGVLNIKNGIGVQNIKAVRKNDQQIHSRRSERNS